MKLEYKKIKIVRRADNRYFARFTKDNKRVSVYGNTQKEAYNKLKKKYNETQSQVKLLELKKLSFHSYCDKWLDVYKKENVTRQTYLTYRTLINKHIKEILPNIDMREISPLMINEAINKTYDRNKEYISQLLRQVFKQAKKDMLVDNDLQDNIIKVVHKRQEGRALTKEQRQFVIDCAKKIEHGIAFVFALFTGCRKGELLRITFNDIDFKNNMLHIPGTKTNLSDRYMPIFDVLKPLIKLQDKTKATLLGISPKTLDRAMVKLKNMCDFKIAFKDFRTTFGTMCAELSIAQKTIAKWMGHTTTETTNKYYIKVLSEFEKEQAKLLNNVDFDTNFDTNFNHKSD